MTDVKKCQVCSTEYTKHINICRKQWSKSKFCSRQCDSIYKKGKIFSPQSIFKTGFKHKLESKIKMRSRKGEKSPHWKGGTTKKNALFRMSAPYLAWRETVRILHDYTCQFCKKRGVEIHVDHVKPFSLYPELRLSINNGRVLCVNCHKKTPSYLNPHLLKVKN